MSGKRPIRILLMTALMITALFLYQPGETSENAYALIPSGGGSALDVMVDAEWRIWGDIETDHFGVSIAAGDLDGDGLGDLAVGIPHSSYGKVAGVVLLFFARDKDELMTINGFSDADVIIQGVNTNDRFGEKLSMIDLDGDGKSELIVSAPFADGIGNARRDCGEIYIISGKERVHYGSMDGIENLTDWGHIIGRDAGDHQGMRMAFGDLNADGIVDLVLGSDGTGGTANSANESVGGSPWGENGVIGSWEIDVILGTGSRLGTHDIGVSGSRVRYYGGHLSDALDIPTHIGNGLVVTDMDGDGHEDLTFSYRYGSEGWVVMSKGGPSFPFVEPNSSYVFPDPAPLTTNNPHPIFKPNLTISLGPDGFDEALLFTGNANGDGHADLLVGMTGAPAWEKRRHSAGQIDLYLGGAIPPSGRMYRSNATWTLFGEDASDRLGTGILMVDREKDGFDEFYIATPNSDGYQNTMDGAGELYGFNFSGSFPRHSNVSDASLIMSGRAGYRSFSEIAIMDMDGNGFPEIVISSPGARNPDGAGSGLISLFGFDTSFEAMFYTEGVGWSAGSKVLFHDLDADGYPDLIISSPSGNDASRGIVHVYFGSDEPWSGRYLDRTDADLYYEHRDPPSFNENYFGYHIAAGDLDNDGYGDLVVYMTSNVVGTGDYNGAIFIFWGGSRAQMASKSFSAINGYSNARFGESFAIGDINGDGIDDLAVGAPDANTATTPSRVKGGRVHVWFGPLSRVTRTATSSPLTIHGAMDRDSLGKVMHVADLDGDGRSEIIMGTPNAKPGSITMQGAVHIVQGADTFPSQMDLADDDCLRIDGEWPYDALGSFLETGDIDGDGRADLLISAPGADGYLRRTSNGGIVYVIEGSHLATKLPKGVHRLRREVSNITIYGSQSGESIGASVHCADIDGDGLPEIALGSPTWFDRDSGKNPGAVSIIMEPQLLLGGSMNSSEIPKILGAGDGSRFGTSIASALVDGDAKYDLVIGAPKYDLDGDGSAQGASFLWLSKTVLPRDVKARTLEIINAEMVLGAQEGPMTYLSSENGPYMMRVEAWSSFGIASIREISLKLMLQGGYGHVLMTYYTDNGTFAVTDSAVFRNRYRLDVPSCIAETDGSMLYRVDFAFVPGWNMPLPEMIVTGIGTDFGSHYNFRSGLFEIDRSIRVDPASVVVADLEGAELPQWFNSSTPFVVTNVSLVHSITGRRLSDTALGSLSFGLFRSDGFRIGTSQLVEGR
ncbi:MAG: FG-GAP-like repeat-containing protein, partial [Candidatus Thermoplasmatota archaeon]|nr:FG-GAP-like repeat-containing protein [Candidatus Thermoplasmatota archaeon]